MVKFNGIRSQIITIKQPAQMKRIKTVCWSRLAMKMSFLAVMNSIYNLANSLTLAIKLIRLTTLTLLILREFKFN